MPLEYNEQAVVLKRDQEEISLADAIKQYGEDDKADNYEVILTPSGFDFPDQFGEDVLEDILNNVYSIGIMREDYADLVERYNAYPADVAKQLFVRYDYRFFIYEEPSWYEKWSTFDEFVDDHADEVYDLFENMDTRSAGIAEYDQMTPSIRLEYGKIFLKEFRASHDVYQADDDSVWVFH